MSKKTNSIVFMLVATVVNLLLLVAFFIIGFVIIGVLGSRFPGLQSAAPILVLLVFGLAIFGSFFVYSRIVKWATVKFSLEDKLDPIFTPKKNRRRKDD